MKKYTISLISILLLVLEVQSQIIDINQNCRNAYTEILSLRFNEAEKRIENEIINNPQNLFIPYLENYIDFLKVTVGEDEELFRRLEKNIPLRINSIKKLSDSSRFKKYLIGNINLQWATAHLKFGNYPTAALEINRAYRLLNENKKIFPNFTPNYITLGILHIMIGIVPDSYSWLLNLISMEGSVQQGQKELLSAFDSCSKDSVNNYLKDEILFYMGTVDLNLSPDPEFANYLLSEINNRNNHNLLLTYLSINTMMKNGRNDEALNLFEKIDTTTNYYPFYYLNYLHGDCYLRSLDTQSALKEYYKFIDDFKGENYIKDAWLKIAWCSLFESDTAGFKKAMNNVLKFGATNIDADKSAEKAARNSVIPNIELLKSRLLFDGGYYDEAQKILLIPESQIFTEKEIVEKNYRLGRIAHQLKNYDDAKKYYVTTIETGSLFPEYFAANAALKLGNIYEVEFDSTRSAHYYKLCLTLDFDEYRNSIRSKAKQGLNRVTTN